MLFRFSLYGFLKNQRYFEPFLVLIFLEKGLSFFLIGLLIGFREVAVNLLEIPSGAIADLFGRRKSMILSFVAYIASFAVFGLARNIGLLFVAMSLFAVGEAFRTGTHKAMIFTWLRLQDRTDERTKVYGYTRSWSKYGSALSVILAAVFVYTSDSYTYVFYFSIIPYLMGLINFLGYPAELDGNPEKSPSLSGIVQHLKETFKLTFTRAGLRRLVLESMGFEGVFHAVKDYLQPVLKAAALIGAAHWVTTSTMSETQQATLLVGPVYFVLYLLSGAASRQAHRIATLSGGEDGAAVRLWAATLILFAALGIAAYYEVNPLLIALFVLLHVIQNFWRPTLISRFDAYGSESQGATVLSIESQSRRAATMVIAPLLGLVVDQVQASQLGGPFWPVGVLGVLVALGFLLTAPKSSGKQPAEC
ncbi:MAG: MFS transporter [Gemmatimonadetes bacterium]|jgi:MFS family permease|nr:MFS transporter [Gemmatimonadota bacterium]